MDRADASDGRRRSSDDARPADGFVAFSCCCALLPSPLSWASTGDCGGGGGADVGSAGGWTGGECREEADAWGRCTGDRWSGDVSCPSECGGALALSSPPTAPVLCSPSPFGPTGGSPASLANDGLRARSSAAAAARSTSILDLAFAAWLSASMYVVYLKISVCR